MKLHDKQREIVSSPARFKTIRAGRKGGKTAMEVENICYKAMVTAERLNLSKTVFATGRKVIYIAPTQIQAREIVWSALKNRLHGVGTPNEQKLQMTVPNEDGTTSTILVGGYENRENYRGLTDVVHITFDETDTFKGFFQAWSDIFRPLFLDTRGTANFIGTPKKENPNLRRLEKEFEDRPDCASFHFTSRDNPHISQDEINDMEREYEGNRDSYKQEVLAEHVDNAGALFSYTALIDLFTNTVTKTGTKYLVIDVADDGSDKTIFSFWDSLECYNIEVFSGLNTETIINKMREYASLEQIPYSNMMVDAIGVGAGVASSSLLEGIVGFKSSYGAIKTDADIVKLPNVHYTNNNTLTTEYANLRSQCIFILADNVNKHTIAIKTGDVKIKDAIIEELATYQDASKGDGKRYATSKDDVKDLIGRSPDISDTLIMRMYFVIRDRMVPGQSQQAVEAKRKVANMFLQGESFSDINSAR